MKNVIALLLSMLLALSLIIILSACDKSESDYNAVDETNKPKTSENAGGETETESPSKNEVIIDLREQGITDKILAEMVKNGEIPQNVTKLYLDNSKPIPTGSVSVATFREGNSNEAEYSIVDSDEVKINYNRLTDLSPLSGLKNLKELNLRNNQIKNLSPLSKLTNLTSLNLYDNPISDISPLSGLKKMEILFFGDNETQLKDLSPLSKLTNLKELYFIGYQIDDISPLSRLTELTDLSLHCNIDDISPLSGLTNLTRLVLVNDQISDLSPLSGLTNLTSLWLFYVPIRDISPLSNLTNLKELSFFSFTTNINEEQKSMLEAALPNCKINW